MTFLKEHLTGIYEWNASMDKSVYEGTATRRLFNRWNGTQVLFIINNFLIQNSIRDAEVLNIGVPDMWVQFGSNTELMRELGLDAESIAKAILQEFFADDYRPLSERKEKAIV